MEEVVWDEGKKVSEASKKTCEQERMLKDEEKGEKMGKKKRGSDTK